MIRVFIVAASAFARAGLQSVLGSLGMDVAGAAETLESFAAQVGDREPDVLLIEASGEQFETLMNSLTTSEIGAELPILLISDDNENRKITAALRAGVRAILPSDTSSGQLAASIEAVTAGLVVMLPSEVEALFPATAAAVSPPLAEPLTRREREILQMLAAGLGNKEIAVRCAISEHTVKFHVASILGKLGVSSRTEAVTVGIRRGIVLL